MGAYDLVNLNKRTNVAPGIATYALIAKKSDFATLPGIAVPTDDTALADTVKIKTAHTFKAGKAWSKWSLAKDKNELSSTGDGDAGFRQFKQTATLFVPGSYAEVHAVMAMLLNEELIVEVKDINCSASMFYQLGNECNGASINPAFKSGNSAGGVKGYEVTVEYSGPCIQIYDAAMGTIMSDESGAQVELTFADNVAMTSNGVTATAPAVDPDAAFAFNVVDGPYPATSTMILKVGATTELTVLFGNQYLGKAFVFTDAAGVQHAGNFVEATLTY
jgi:hypothetical protein